jgi:uncharacterized membrane protein
MTIVKGFGLTLATIGVMILLYSLSFDGERLFDIPNGGIFLGIIATLLGIIVYIYSKKSNGMIRVR